MRLRRVLLALVTMACLMAPLAAQNLEADLQRAVQREATTGDLKRAIADYQDIAARAGSDGALAARVLLHLGAAQEGLSQRAEATQTYQRVVREYPTQRDAVGQAQGRLTALGLPLQTLTERTLLTRDGSMPHPMLSSSGTTLTFVDESSAPGRPAVVDLATGRVTHVLAESSSTARILFPVVSPDGGRVIFVWAGAQGIELRVAGTAVGSPSRTIRAADAAISYFEPRAWSRDGRSVLIELQRADQTWQLAWLTVENGRLQFLKSLDWRRDEGMARPTVSPDGRYIAYGALATNPSKPDPMPSDLKDQHIYLLASDGSSEVDLTPVTGISDSPIWSPDGSHVLYLSDRLGTIDLWAVSVSAGKAIGHAFVVKPGVGRIRPVGMSPNGAYLHVVSSRGVPMLSFANAGTSGAASASSTGDLVGSLPVWSPDGKHVAFLRPKPGGGGDRELVVRTVDTGSERRYSGGEDVKVDNSAPIWMHDGRTVLQAVVFPGLTQGQRPNKAFFSADLQTGEFQEITVPGRFFMQAMLAAALAPDDKTMFLRGPVGRGEGTPLGPNDRIVACDLATGTWRDVATAPSGSLFNGLALSSDGRTLAAFVLSLGTGPAVDFQAPIMRLVAVGTDGAGFREVYGPFVTASLLMWARAGREIWIKPGVPSAGALPAPGPVLRIDATSGSVIATDSQLVAAQALALSPDGSTLVISKAATGNVTAVHAIEGVSARLKRR